MNKQHFFAPYPDAVSQCGILPAADPFSEGQRSKSAEHTDRTPTNEKSEKTEKTGEIKS